MRWKLALAALGLLILNLLAAQFSKGILGPQDWYMWTLVESRLRDGRLYEHGAGYFFVWSPLAAWILAYVIVPLGYPVFLALHLLALAWLRSAALIGLALLSLPFWVDAIVGNAMVFVVVSGFAALGGSRVGTLVFLALCLLTPRPVQLPMLVWLLALRPSSRLPFALMAALTILAAGGSGFLDDWLGVLVRFGTSQFSDSANMSPTHWFGLAWLAIGIPLAIWLTGRNRLGLAGLALSPYVYPQYLLALLWEARSPGPSAQRLRSEAAPDRREAEDPLADNEQRQERRSLPSRGEEG